MTRLMRDLPQGYRHNEPVGVTKYFNHVACGDTKRRLAVTRVNGGFLYHCHNCAGEKTPYSGFAPNKERSSPETTLKHIKQLLKEQNQLPSQLNPYVPYKMEPLGNDAQDWLNQLKITREERDKFRLSYDPISNRLLFPVFEHLTDPLPIAIQSRRLGPEKTTTGKTIPKWITVRKVTHPVAFGACSRHQFEASYDLDDLDAVVIVEDIPSAIKVSRVCDCIALLGSYLSEEIIGQLDGMQCILVWLDHDKRAHALHMANTLKLRYPGAVVSTIDTLSDPKVYSSELILDTITDKIDTLLEDSSLEETGLVICPECERRTSALASSCGWCGAGLTNATPIVDDGLIHCETCGNEIAGFTEECPWCGMKHESVGNRRLG